MAETSLRTCLNIKQRLIGSSSKKNFNYAILNPNITLSSSTNIAKQKMSQNAIELKDIAVETKQNGNGLSKLRCAKFLLMCLLIDVIVAIVLFGSDVTKFTELLPNFPLFDLFVSVREKKTILVWNSAHRIETSGFGFGYKPFVQHRCEVSDCILFDNATLSVWQPLESYDAIIVNMHELWLTEIPAFNRQHFQRLIFLTQESPTTMPIDVYVLGNIFNWTMTYRLNSDVKLLYGRIEAGPTAPKTSEETLKMIERTRLPSSKNYATTKTNLVAWMASHCETNGLRETYVRQLQKFIPVDIYGECGNLTCPRNDHWISYPECYTMLEEKYKFYLSFENSICTDYATEKFFEVINRNIVPIVYGGANYSQIAPHHSVINALDFTPEKLAEFLKMVDANDTIYNEYFWWKGHYQVEAGIDQMTGHAFCDLCKKLHEEHNVTKYYPEVETEWHADKHCKQVISWETNQSSTTSN